PRMQWTGGRHIQLEREVPAHIAAALARRGHEVEILNVNSAMGRGQIIWRTDNGLLAGGTEPRCDGAAAAW
ncbi:MAG: gamma-glutamyltransferase, partial [Clostridium lundense]|nr:gamma-glutamyltransferase [Clostridium lundense]